MLLDHLTERAVRGVLWRKLLPPLAHFVEAKGVGVADVIARLPIAGIYKSHREVREEEQHAQEDAQKRRPLALELQVAAVLLRLAMDGVEEVAEDRQVQAPS